MKENSTILELNLNQIFPFELDDFQQQAIAALDVGKSVVVCAPTGSGKTIIGEYAIYRAMSRGKRVFYTTPLKALSNQKFRDFQEQFGSGRGNPKEVGLITGDILINPNASVVVMTTEIFRNMLYETPIGQVGTSVEDVESVVLDECHYISDRGRGTVWEESIIYCPPQIQIVGLSATIGNPEQLTEWINTVRERAAEGSSQENKYICDLIDSDLRPVPLRYHFINKKGLFPLLNNKDNKLNSRLKSRATKGNRRRANREDCPSIEEIVLLLQEKNMLPAIYVIFSRRGCDRAVEQLESLNLLDDRESWQLQEILLEFFLADLEIQQNLLAQTVAGAPELHQKLLSYLANNSNAKEDLLQFLVENPQTKLQLLQFLGESSKVAKAQQLEPLTRGIAAHHAGLLPAWKELAEKLFELGLVKLIFATATLSAGINMPARTTVISSLSKRSDDGHRLLTPSEFLQIAGRAGRRGKDKVGHVVTVQTPFEGAKEAAYLSTAKPEPLRSWFTPSYGMVLNLLQKHTIEEAKSLLERSFAEYLAQLKLGPEKQAIASITTELAKLDIELASVELEHFASYEKLREKLREEYRILEILQKQAEETRKLEIAPFLPEIQPGKIIYLKGQHVRVFPPLAAVLVLKIPPTKEASTLICLGIDNQWYVGTPDDVVDISQGSLPPSELEKLSLPDLQTIQLGRWRKGNETTAAVCDRIPEYVTAKPPATELIEQQERIKLVETELENHPLQKWKSPGKLIKRHKRRLILREQLHKSQVKYQKHKSYSSYYWEEFLNLIEVLREFQAISGFTATLLGEAAAAIRSENELWIGLALMSGVLDYLQPHHLASAVSALITETPRSDAWCDWQPSTEVLEALGDKKRNGELIAQNPNLWETRRRLNQIQNRYDVAMPVWLERKLIGLVEQWALGKEWEELCENTSLDEGDLVRMLRRTVDILWQIPQVPGVSETLKDKARAAVSQMKRFPV